MRFLILRLLTHSELGMFHEYRRQGKEGSKQRAINFDGDVVDRVFPAAKDTDSIALRLAYDTDIGVSESAHRLKRQDKNWRLEGNCPKDRCYSFVEPGSLFVMEVDAGRTPAVGAWAVFPAKDGVTESVLADGESGGLARSAMIALHGEETHRIRRIVASARADLFPPTASAIDVAPPVGVPSPGKRKQIPPNPARLVNLLAAVGHTLQSAVADLVDNSITAEATEIDITFGRPDAGHGRWMCIRDNGKGMSPAVLEEAMRLGSDSHYEDNSLGKYGYGLKGASWSQARVFTVVTKQEGAPIHHLTWDLEDMSGWRVKSEALEEWERDAADLGRRGTAVLWKNMKVPATSSVTKGLDPHSGEVMQLERHLALVFHRFLEGRAAGRGRVAIRINGNVLKANNPVGHPLVTAYDVKTIRVPTETRDGKVLVQPFVLPSEDEMISHHQGDGQDGPRRALEQIGLYGKRNESQGLFIYRHDRLIRWGGWHQMWETNDEKTKLARVVVDFDHVLDDSFKINISKQIVHLPQHVQAEVKKLADPARKESQRKYRKEARTAAPPPPAPSPAPLIPLGGGAATPPTAAPMQVHPTQAPRVSLKEVTTDKFVWKVAKGLTGSLDVQVSGQDQSLASLVRQIRDDPHALAQLASFLSGLDELNVQSQLLSRGTK